MQTIRLIMHLAKVNLLDQLAFPHSFILGVVSKLTRMSILLLFFHVLYQFTPTLAGWSSREIPLLVATYLTVESAILITFHRNLFYYFPMMLNKGSYDLVLVQPVSPLFMSAFRTLDLLDVTSFVPVLALWWYAITTSGVVLSLGNVLAFLVLLLCAIVTIFAIEVALAATGFWTLRPFGLGRLTENVIRLGRFPSELFTGAWRFLLTYVLPVALVATLPAEALRGLASPLQIIVALVVTGALLAVALSFWKFALRHYSSASA